MRTILRNLTRVSGVQGTVLVDRDGMVILSDLEADVEDERVGAMAASIVATVEDSLQKVHRGPLIHLQMDAEEGKILVQEAGKALLVVLTEKAVNIGLIRLEMKTAAGELRQQQDARVSVETA
ncbi:MAG: roadblock/LC7 domain-containing protein [Armatimonadota bacterium]|jgi:predicted regulator of Ras-like GTPase activity (Roadblock/LC7/MglB family)